MKTQRDSFDQTITPPGEQGHGRLSRSSVARWIAGAVAIVFGIATLKAGGQVLFGGDAARAAAGNVVTSVLVFNFTAGFLYVAAGIAIWLGSVWAIHMARALERLRRTELGRRQPALEDLAIDPHWRSPALASPPLAAVLVETDPHRVSEVQQVIKRWGDVSVYTQGEEENLLLGGVVQRARMQIGLFTIILTVTAAVIVMMVIYNLTLEKTHDIAVLKLLGAPRSRLLGLVLTSRRRNRSSFMAKGDRPLRPTPVDGWIRRNCTQGAFFLARCAEALHQPRPNPYDLRSRRPRPHSKS